MTQSRSCLLAIWLLAAPAAARAQEPAPQAPPQAPPQPAPPTRPEPQPAPAQQAPAVEETHVGTANDDVDAGDDHGDESKPLEYKPREGITVRAGKARLKFFVAAETVFEYGHCQPLGDAPATACPVTDTLSIHVRRARFAVAANLPHHLSLDFAVQVKNEILVLKNAHLGWKHDGYRLRAGFFKPPGGLERDASTWVKPFPERSVVANFKQDRIIGLGISKWVNDHTLRLQGAAGHAPVGNFDAFEPEDVVLPPPGIEEEDLTTDPANWMLFASAVYAPSDNFELGLNATAHISPDAGKGPNFAEPYETKILPTRFIKNGFFGGGFDVAWHNDHVRATAELVLFHSGQTIPHLDPVTMNPIEPVTTTNGTSGYAVLGYTWDGEYGPAIENCPLIKGHQLLVRGEFMRVTPGNTIDTTALFFSVTGGVQWQVYKQLRLQTDLAVQKYNDHVVPESQDSLRYYGEIWGQVVM